jgi:Spy/CpxP family protein refolding chaperone
MFHRSLALGLVALLATATPALAGPAGWAGRGEDAESHMDRLMERLHLNADQRIKIKEIRRKHMDATAEPRKRYMEKRKALFQLVRGVEAKKDQALALQREIDALQAQLAEDRLAAWFECRSVLTHEQLQTLSSLKPEGRPRPHP